MPDDKQPTIEDRVAKLERRERRLRKIIKYGLIWGAGFFAAMGVKEFIQWITQ